MSAIFWGVAGACAQYVFQNKGLTVDWLVSFRLLSGGGILLLYAKLRGRAVGAIWRDQRAWPSLLIFGLIGMLGVQYTYFAAIRHSNAATGTGAAIRRSDADCYLLCHSAPPPPNAKRSRGPLYWRSWALCCSPHMVNSAS